MAWIVQELVFSIAKYSLEDKQLPTDFEQGIATLQRGDAGGAIPYLEAAESAEPQNHLVPMYLGAAYGQTGRHNDAVTALTRAVTLQPGNAQSRFNLGIALERAGWRDQAVTAYQQAITLQPDYPQARDALRRLQGEPVVPQMPVHAAVAVAPVASPVGATLNQSPAPPAYAAQPAVAVAPHPGMPPAYNQAPYPPSQPAAPYAAGQPAPMPPTYNAPAGGMHYNAPPLPGRGAPAPTARVTAEANTGKAAAAAIVIALACGAAYGLLSVAAGMRIPFLGLVIGYAVGYGTRAAAGAPSETSGVVAGLATVLACALGYGIMYLAGLQFLPLTILIVGGYGFFRAMRIAGS